MSELPVTPRSDAVVWRITEQLAAHPMISALVAVAATGCAKTRVYEAIKQFEAARVLTPLSDGRRNSWWEVAGPLDLTAQLESGVLR